MLSPKILPQKTYSELMDENLSKIPIYTHEWTNYNPSDPGITILENLAGAQIIQQNRMDEVTDDVRAKLLKLLGYTPRKGQGARVYVEPSDRKERLHIFADQRFMVGDMCFETSRAIEVTDSRLIGVYKKKDEECKDFSYILNRNITLLARIFGRKPEVGNELYLVMDKPLMAGEQAVIHVDVANDYGRNPFSEEQKDVFARLKWECYCEDGFVEMEVTDNTAGFLMNGELQFTQPESPAAFYEEGDIKGYVWRATLTKSEYDIAPALKYMSGFLFQIVQKETKAITHSFQKGTDICMKCNMLEDGYISVFAKEQKGSSYRKYEECVDDIYGELPQGRYYRMERTGHGEAEFSFDRERFGYGPANIKNPVKIVVYNEEMMRKYYLGEIYGYDNQEIRLPVGHIVTETFCVIARREDGEGGYLYDFLRPNKMDEKKMSYYLYENEGKIVILDAGDYIGASLFIGSLAVVDGEDGNVRKGNTFVSPDLGDSVTFLNPARGEGGRFQESLEQVRHRFVEDMNTPQTAVVAEDYRKLVSGVPGLCIAKANAWRDDDRNEIQVAVMPRLAQDFPRLSEAYTRVLSEYLESRRLLSTAIRILQPVYVPVNVSGKIYVKPHLKNCEQIINKTLTATLDYIHGEQSFGEPLRFDRVFHALDALECVSYVYELHMMPAKAEYVSQQGADLYPAMQCLLYPGKVSLEILTAV